MNIKTIKNIGVGVDIEKVSRFRKVDQQFLEKIYSKKEIKYCYANIFPAQHLAARFCAKEATKKALLNCGFKSVGYKMIEIITNKSGYPEIRIHKKGLENIITKVSLSHTKEIAIAFVIVNI